MSLKTKLLLILVFLSFIPTISLAGPWNGWIKQDPYPVSETLFSAKFLAPQKGWAVGKYGIIIHTRDSGDNWELQESGTWEDLKSITFVNAKAGWAVGENGVIVHTEDGGKRWTPQGNTKASLHKVFFLNEKEGWATGDRGLILSTKDGGKSWNERPLGTRQSLASIFFINPYTGWLLAGTKIYRTTDGGNKWEAIALPVHSPGIVDETWSKGDIFFLDGKSGWAVLGYWYVLSTKDGGKTWTVDKDYSSMPEPYAFETVSFTDAKTGCVGTSNILCTEDGGKTWTERLKPDANGKLENFDLHIYNLAFVDKSTAWGVGWDGIIVKTEDGGKSWKVVPKIERQRMLIINDKAAFAYGGRDGTISRTDDGGITWNIQKKFDMSTGISGRYFFDDTTGWFGGIQEKETKSWNTVIVHTKDGGKTWGTQYDEPGPFITDIYFVDPSTGWAVGRDGLILHTSDGGNHWVRQKSGTKFWLEYVFFVDVQKGWALGEHPEKSTGEESIVLYTEDGGESWRVQLKKEGLWLHSVIFTDSNTGWISGSYGVEEGEVALLHTKDGGKTWSEKPVRDISGAALFFIDKERGVLLADKNRYYITKDGGKTWERKRTPARKRIWHVSELFGKVQSDK